MSGAYLGQMIVQILGQTSQFDESVNNSKKVFAGFHDSVINSIGGMTKSINTATENFNLLTKGLEAQKDNLSKLEQKMQDLVNNGALPMSNEIVRLDKEIAAQKEYIKDYQKSIDSTSASYSDASGSLDIFGQGIKEQISAMASLKGMQSELKKQIQDLIIEYANSDKVISEVVNIYNEATKSVNDMKNKIADSKSEIASYRKTWDDLGTSFEKGELLARDLQKQSIDLREAIATTSKQVNSYEKALNTLNYAQEYAKEDVIATKEKYDAMVPTIEELKSKYKDLTEDIKRLESLSKDYDNTLQGLNNHIKDNKDKIQELINDGMSPYSKEIMNLKVQNDELSGKVAYLNESSKSLNEMLNEMSKTSAKLGVVLSASLTAPIVAAGKAAYESAAQFEVYNRKFESLFSDIMPQAVKALIDVQAAYGLTSKQATAFIANASTAFVAMGATNERALEMAQTVVQLTAAISAYSGKPMTDVSQALDLALLGNTRNLRNYGLAIRQSAVDDELAAQGKDKLTGAALQLATSEVALKLILEAAQVPLKNFSENSTSAAFQGQQLKAKVDELSASLGTLLMPALKSIIGDLSKFVESLNMVDESTKAGVITFAAFLALLGPIELGISALTKGILALQAAMAAGTLTSWTTLLPIIAAAVVALTGAIVAFKKSADVKEQQAQWENFSVKLEENKDKADSLADEYQKLYEKTNRTAAETKRMSDIVDELQKLYPKLTKEQIESGAANQALIDEYNSLKDKTNLTANEQDRLSKVTDELNKLYPDFTKNTKELATANDTLKGSINGVSKAQKEQDATTRLATLSKKLALTAKDYIAMEDQLNFAINSALGVGKKPEDVEKDPHIVYLRNELKKIKEEEGKLLAEYEKVSNDVYGIPKPVVDKDKTTPPPKGTPQKTQGQELKELDDKYKQMIELAKENGQDVADVEKEYYNARLNLLYDFLDRDVKANKVTWATIDKDLDSNLSVFGTTIRHEISETYKSISNNNIKTSIKEITDSLNNGLSQASTEFETTRKSIGDVENAAELEAEAETKLAESKKSAYDSAVKSLITLLVTNKNLSEAERKAINDTILSYQKQSNALDSQIKNKEKLVEATTKVKDITDSYDTSITKLNNDIKNGSISEEDANKSKFETMKKARDGLLEYVDVSSSAREADIKIAADEQTLLQNLTNKTLDNIGKVSSATRNDLLQFVADSVKANNGYTRNLLDSLNVTYKNVLKYSEDTSKAVSDNASKVLAISVKLAEDASNTMDATVRQKMLDLSKSILDYINTDASDVQTMVNEQVAKFNIDSVLDKLKGVSKEAYDSAVAYIENFLSTGGKYGADLQKEIETRFNNVNTSVTKLKESLIKQRDETGSAFIKGAINDTLNLIDEWAQAGKSVEDIVKDAGAKVDRATQQEIVNQIKTVDSGLGDIAQKYLDNADTITGTEKAQIDIFKKTSEAIESANSKYADDINKAEVVYNDAITGIDKNSAAYVSAQIARDTAIKNATLSEIEALLKLKGTSVEVDNIIAEKSDKLIAKSKELNETLKQESLTEALKKYNETVKENSEILEDNTAINQANQKALEAYISNLKKVKDTYGDTNGSIDELIRLKSKEYNAQKSDLEIKTEIENANEKYKETVDKINASNDTDIEKKKKLLDANIQLRDSLLKYVGVSEKASEQVKGLDIEINKGFAEQLKNIKANDNELSIYTSEYEKYQTLASDAMVHGNKELADSLQAIADAYKKLIGDVKDNYAASIVKIENDLTLKIRNAQDVRTAMFYASQLQMVKDAEKAGTSIEEINKKLAENQYTFDVGTTIENAYDKINETASSSILKQIELFKFLRDTTVGLTEDEKKKIDAILSSLVEQIRDYTDDITKIVGSGYSKQLVDITSKRNADLKSLKNMEKDELTVIAQRESEELAASDLTESKKAEIIAKYEQQRQGVKEKYANAGVTVNENAEKDILNLKKKYLNEFTTVNKTELAKQVADINAKREKELQSLEEGYKNALDAAEGNAEEIEKINKAYSDRKVEINKKADADIIQSNLDMVNSIASSISSIAKAFDDLFSGVSEKQDDFIGDLIQGIGSIVSIADAETGTIITAVGQIYNTIKSVSKSVTEAMASFISKIIHGEDITEAGLLKRNKLTAQIQTLEQQIIGYRQQGLEEEYNNEVEKINKAKQEALEALGFVDQYGNDLLDKQYQSDLDAIDKKKQAELEALGFVDQYGRDLLDKQHQEQMDDIDEREKAELAALGLIDNTESQNLAESMTKKQREINTEISSRKRAILQAELAELASEKKKADIKQKYEDERAAAEKKYQEEKAIRDQILFNAETERLETEKKYEEDKAARDKILYDNQIALQAAEADYQAKSKKFIHDKAVSEQKLALAEAEIAKEKAIHDASKEDKAAVEAEYDRVIAAIKSLPIPEAKSGGVVMPKSGGTIVKVAEANMAEAIIPLDKLNQVISSISSRSFQTSLAPIDTGDIHLVVNLDDKPILEKIFPATRNRTVKIDARSIVGNI